MRFTRLILALTSFLILITQTDLFASTVLHKTSMVDLSNNAIICMHQDPDGYLWIGTYDGLNLYNGKDTYVYRFELNNKNSLCSNIIHKISDAEPGFLWISTSIAIKKLSLKNGKSPSLSPDTWNAIYWPPIHPASRSLFGRKTESLATPHLAMGSGTCREKE